jgi:hypothetical protein
MSSPINHTQRIHRPEARAFARRDSRQPWVHHGVASERVHRAEQAYTAELAHAEHHARARAAMSAGSAR